MIPKLSFHLVSTRRSDQDDLTLSLDIASYEEWLNRRLDELVAEARRSQKRSLRRKTLAMNFAFPFENPRPGQRDLISAIETQISSSTSLNSESSSNSELNSNSNRMWIQGPDRTRKDGGRSLPPVERSPGARAARGLRDPEQQPTLRRRGCDETVSRDRDRGESADDHGKEQDLL